jgi:ubiquinone/menaquinone biosynthesis C-methylase UbiE
MTQTDERRRVARVYDRYAHRERTQRAWSAANAGNIAIRAELVERALELLAGKPWDAHAVLDIGCGSGWWLQRLDGYPQMTARLHALELLPDRAAAAKARVPAAAVLTGDARKLPYEGRSFDVVTMFTVLSSLPTLGDAERAVAEARRVLRPGGALLIWEPRVQNPLNRDTIPIGIGLLERALAGTRLEVVTTTVLPPLARRLGRRTQSLYPRLARIGALRTHRLACAWIPNRS